MKRNCRFLIVLSLFAWMAVGLKAQDRLVVQMKNGAQTQYDLSQLKKLIFSGAQFTVVVQVRRYPPPPLRDQYGCLPPH